MDEAERSRSVLLVQEQGICVHEFADVIYYAERPPLQPV